MNKINNHSFSFVENSIESSPTLNSRKNIISGPRIGDYWFHSPGLEMPDIREEGPFPIQGNIGSLLKQEGNNNYNSCSNKLTIGGGPNCVGVFNKDIYTENNTCGKNCDMEGPESYGIQNFGFINNIDTNMHGLHAYKNIRAGSEGKGPSNVYGCYESIPNLKDPGNNTCITDYDEFEANTVGNFTKLDNWKKFANYTYN
jgi:hypothetical protein